jgi:hypothetical protein
MNPSIISLPKGTGCRLRSTSIGMLVFLLSEQDNVAVVLPSDFA